MLLKLSDGFTRPLSSAGSILGFSLTMVLLAKVLEVIPTSIAYTVWTGAGSALIAILGVALFGEVLTTRAVTGIVLVVAGVAILNLSDRRPARASFSPQWARPPRDRPQGTRPELHAHPLPRVVEHRAARPPAARPPSRSRAPAGSWSGSSTTTSGSASRTDEGDGDAWPQIRQQVLDADIVGIATPVWMGQPSR